MIDDPSAGINPSHEALRIFAQLRRSGGSVRLAPLLRTLAMDERVFVDAVIDLSDRYWIIIIWRKAPPKIADAEIRPYTQIDRLCTTFFGRGSLGRGRLIDLYPTLPGVAPVPTLVPSRKLGPRAKPEDDC